LRANGRAVTPHRSRRRSRGVPWTTERTNIPATSVQFQPRSHVTDEQRRIAQRSRVRRPIRTPLASDWRGRRAT
jgi:hypothetical protein